MARLDGRVATALLLVAALTAHISLENLAQAARDEEKKAGQGIDVADANTEVVCCGSMDRAMSDQKNRKACQIECQDGGRGGQRLPTKGDQAVCFSGWKCKQAKKSKTRGASGKLPEEAAVSVGRKVGVSNGKKGISEDDGTEGPVDLSEMDPCEIAKAVTHVANWEKRGTVKYDYMKKGPLTDHTCADVSDKLCTLDKRISEKAFCKNKKCKRVANLYVNNNCLEKRTRMVDGMVGDFADGGSKKKQGVTQGPYGSNLASSSKKQSRSSPVVDVSKELQDETKQDKRKAIVLIEAVLNICNQCSHTGNNWANFEVKGSRPLDGESLDGESCKELAQRLCSLELTKGKSGCNSIKTNSCKNAATFTIKKYDLQRLFGKGTETQKKLSDRSKCNPRCQKQ